jgi:hypothetical protein
MHPALRVKSPLLHCQSLRFRILATVRGFEPLIAGRKPAGLDHLPTRSERILPAGIAPATHRLEDGCSTLLSYGSRKEGKTDPSPSRTCTYNLRLQRPPLYSLSYWAFGWDEGKRKRETCGCRTRRVGFADRLVHWLHQVSLTKSGRLNEDCTRASGFTDLDAH